MTFICSGSTAPPTALRRLTELRHCCVGAFEDGPTGCTCWEPVYDLHQQPWVEGLAPTQRPAMCHDCAYRPDSPERTGDDRHTASEEGELDDIARGDNPFWCHQGMRKPTGWRHTTLGIFVPADTDAYDPPIVPIDGHRVPLRADGTPGERCAGWLARKLQLAVADIHSGREQQDGEPPAAQGAPQLTAAAARPAPAQPHQED